MTEPAALPPLHHLRVLDLTTELGTLAGRFLAGFGAKVIRIEPSAGDALRQKAPMTAGANGEPVSLYWLHMMANHDLLPLDIEDPANRASLLSLFESADIVLESQPVGRLAALGLDYEHLGPLFPHLIWTSVTPFGRTGPRAHWQATDIIGVAAGGLMSLCGDTDRPPLRVSVEQGYAQAGVQAVVGTLVAPERRTALMRHRLRPVLAAHPGPGLRIPRRYDAWLREQTERLRHRLRSGNYAVHGVLPAPARRPGVTTPDEERVLALAMQVLLGPAIGTSLAERPVPVTSGAEEEA